jgi:hypothetical protein
MITKTRIAVIAAVLVGSASAALADNSQFDANIYRPAIQYSPVDAFAQSPSRTWGNGSTGTVKSYSSEEQRWFEKAQGAAD